MKLMGITGKSGAWKTTFSNILAQNEDVGVIHIDDLLREIKLKYFKSLMQNSNKGEKTKVNSGLKMLIYKNRIVFNLFMKFRAKLLKKRIDSKIQELQDRGKKVIIIDDIFIKSLHIYDDLEKVLLVERSYVNRKQALRDRDDLTLQDIVASDIAHFKGIYKDTHKNSKIENITNKGSKEELFIKAKEIYEKYCISQKSKFRRSVSNKGDNCEPKNLKRKERRKKDISIEKWFLKWYYIEKVRGGIFMKILLKNGRLIDYKTKTDEVTDILINDNKIEKIAKDINEKADRIIDCTNLNIIPGMIDMHCHLREPGFEYKETIETGAKSAVCGGFTTICPMPNTKPTPDSAIILQKIIKEGKRVNLCNILPFASVSKGEKGEELVNFDELKNAGAIGFSDDGMPVVNSRMMREAMIKADSLGSFVSSHCEEKSVSSGAINAGKVADSLGVEGVLPEAEEIMAAREIVISETNNVRGHICHISTKTSKNMIRDAKKRGVKITCETCPHYFTFTVDEVLNSGANAKMNPPLREEKDRQAIIEGLKEGTIDAIITDHAPHSEEEKNRDLSKAPNGIIGFETALSAEIMNLVDTGDLSYLDLVRVTSYNPAKLLKIDRGTIEEGKVADITIFDPNERYTYTKDMIVSKSKNSPFIGKELKGKVKYTIVNGKVVYAERKANIWMLLID